MGLGWNIHDKGQPSFLGFDGVATGYTPMNHPKPIDGHATVRSRTGCSTERQPASEMYLEQSVLRQEET